MFSGLNPAIGFLRSELLGEQREGIENYCHGPIIIRDENANLDTLIMELRGHIEEHSDIPKEKDVVFVWGENEKRVITGAHPV